MSNVEVYTFENADGTEDGFTTTDAVEAREYAKANGLKWIANIYEWADSELVRDYTGWNDEHES